MKNIQKKLTVFVLSFLMTFGSGNLASAGTPAFVQPLSLADQQAFVLNEVRKIRHSEIIRIYNRLKPVHIDSLPTLEGIDPWVFIFLKPPSPGRVGAPAIDWSQAAEFAPGNDQFIYDVASNAGNYLLRFPDRGGILPQGGYPGVAVSLIDRNTNGEFIPFASESYTGNPAMQAAYNQTISLGLVPEIFWFTSASISPEFSEKKVRLSYEKKTISHITHGKFGAFHLRAVPLNNQENRFRNEVVLSETYLRGLRHADGTPVLSENFWGMREEKLRLQRANAQIRGPWLRSLDRRELRDLAWSDFNNFKITQEQIVTRAYAQVKNEIEGRFARGEITQQQRDLEVRQWLNDRKTGMGMLNTKMAQAERKFRKDVNRFLRSRAPSRQENN